MAYQNYKHLIGKLDSKILVDMVRFSEELTDDQKNKLYNRIKDYKETNK